MGESILLMWMNYTKEDSSELVGKLELKRRIGTG
jgi:hypothetical protein